ncbi:MAG TPA: acetylornithine/succinylornithine family transaminase [Armatimonadota bacterium]
MGTITANGPLTEHVISDDKSAIMGTYGRVPVAFARGEGMHLWDVEGNRFLDMVSGGRAGGGLGHCHPKLVAAIQKQAATLCYVSNDYYSPVRSELAKRLSEKTHGYKAFFCNSGGEAIEGAIKIARKWAKKAKGPDAVEILTAYQSFHGRTYGAMSATGQDKYKEGFEPIVPGFRHMRFMDRQVVTQNMPDDTCAVMLETVQGESGVYPAGKEYLQDVRRLTAQKNVLLILDEVQAGFGRCGSFWAYEQAEVQPDIVTLAKSLGGGLPMGVFMARPDVAEVLGPGTHGSTFGGNPLASAAALAALDVLDEENLVQNAKEMGDYFRHSLAGLKREGKPVKEVRGMGLMIGVELVGVSATQVQKKCHEAGLLIHTVGENILRILPALIVKKEHIDEAVGIIASSLD